MPNSHLLIHDNVYEFTVTLHKIKARAKWPNSTESHYRRWTKKWSENVITNGLRTVAPLNVCFMISYKVNKVFCAVAWIACCHLKVFLTLHRDVVCLMFLFLSFQLPNMPSASLSYVGFAAFSVHSTCFCLACPFGRARVGGSAVKVALYREVNRGR